MIKRLKEAGAFEKIDLSLDYQIKGENVLSTFINCNHIVFEVTNKCQLACDYCTYGKLYESSEDYRDIELPVHKAKKIIQYLNDNGYGGWQGNSLNKLTIGFYGGEPLLRPDFISSIIEFNKSLNISPQYAITTNGILLKKHIEMLVENDFQILVSLDGNEEGNSARSMINGKPSFDKIIEPLSNLKNKYPEFYKTNVSLNAVLTKYTDIAREINYFENGLGLFNWNFNSIAKFGIQEENIKGYEELRYKGEIPNNDILIKNNIKNLCWNAPVDYNLLFEDNFKFPFSMPTNTCIPFSKKAFISSTGYLFACERIGMNMPLGYIGDNSVEIYSEDVSIKYNDILDNYRQFCIYCQKFPVCTKCALQSERHSGCSEYLNENKIVEWLSDNFSKLNNRMTTIDNILDNARMV